MQEILDRIEVIAGAGLPIRFHEVWDKLEVDFNLPPGATAEQLRLAEQRLGLPLNPAFRQLLERWDGPALYQLTEVGGPRNMPRGGVFVRGTGMHGEHSTLRWFDNDETRMVVIASCNGNVYLMRPDQDTVYAAEECSGSYQVQAASLEAFLQQIIEHEGVFEPIPHS